MNWKFNRNNYTPDAEMSTFEPVPEGDYRVKIEAVTESKSKKGNDMITILLVPEGYEATKLNYFLVFLPDKPGITDQNLGAIWDSFGIQEGNFSFASWVGKVGAAKIEDDLKDSGKIFSKVARFHSKAKQVELGLDKSREVDCPI